VVLERPEPEPDFPQRLCLDKGYDNDTGYLACIDHGYTPHITPIRDERPAQPTHHKPRRWVVESGRSPGSRYAEASSSAGTSGPRTTSASFNSPAACSGFAVLTASQLHEMVSY
jgi:hypothetical protein